ncbi:MAG TPA: restriction endonuclease subunit S [Allosphingosinicella sp.]|jgi:type I restriction enzyme M protein
MALNLDISIVSVEALGNENPKLRLDSQFQSKRVLEAIGCIRRREHTTIGELVGRSLKGRNIPYAEEGDFAVVRSGDISRNFQPQSLLRSFDSANAFFLAPNDILISSIGQGSIGKIQLFRTPGRFAAVSEVTVLRPPKDQVEITAAFLSGKYGQAQIARYVTGATGQLHLYPSDVDLIFIPCFGSELRSMVRQLYALEWETYREALDAQRAVVAYLLEALGMDTWRPSNPLSYVGSAEDAVAAGRLDAQYFRPLYQEVEQRLLATKSAKPLANILTVNARGRQPDYAEVGAPVINSKHVRENRVVLRGNRVASAEGAKVDIRTGDVLLNGTGEGTIGRAAAYLHKHPALPDNHVTVLRSDGVDPVYLAAFLNSPLGQLQMQRHIRGSSGQIELYPRDIEKLIFWDAPPNVQAATREIVFAGFNAERRAQSYLAVAIRATEIATQDGDAAAVNFLKQAEH